MYYNKRLHPRQPGEHGVHYQGCSVQQYNRLVEFFEQAHENYGTHIEGCKVFHDVICTCGPSTSNGLVE